MVSHLAARLPVYQHWYLCILGVDPRFQGKGYAGKMVRAMLARIDKEGVPCFLETMTEKNVSIYEHLGFRVLEKSAIPKTNLTNWAMLRDAKHGRDGQ